MFEGSFIYLESFADIEVLSLPEDLLIVDYSVLHLLCPLTVATMALCLARYQNFPILSDGISSS